MGITYAEVTLRAFNDSGVVYKARFLVDTGALDCVAPAPELERIGVRRRGRRDYELAYNRRVAFDYGLVQIELGGEITAGRVVFGPEGAEPIIGVTALETASFKVNPVTQELEKLPASMLK
ncbi:MAG: clan AA aspartic protease [Calditrichota bacterium]